MQPIMIRHRLKSFAARFGIDISRRRIVSGMHYGPIIPLATYSPWFDDREFMRTFRIAEKNTLVDIYRCHELWELVGQVADVPGALLEVGVWRGGTGAIIAARAKQLGMSKMTYLCDTFEGVAKAGAMDTTYRGGEHADTSQSMVEGLLQRLDLTNVEILKGIFPDDAKDALVDERFAFVHVDVDVYQSAKGVVEFCWPRMPVGGVVVFDDYGFWSCDGIPKLVGEYRGKEDRIVLHNLNGHAVMIKKR
jgi:O-methyltransferase